MNQTDIGQIRMAYSKRQAWALLVLVRDNYWHGRETYSYEGSLEAGRLYLVGQNVSPGRYIKHYRSPLTAWQKLAYAWALANPAKMLIVEGDSKCWHVYKRGDYVEFRLPHHDAGGERTYISNNGKSKIMVDLD